MNDVEKIAVFCGFFFCLIGLIAFVQGNVMGAVFLSGLGLIIVGVVAGFIKELFDTFVDIFESIVDSLMGR